MRHCGVNGHVTRGSYHNGHKQLVPFGILNLDEVAYSVADVAFVGVLDGGSLLVARDS